MSQSKKYNEFIELLKLRKSIRKYKKAEIPLEDIKRMISAASLAPSASNSQNWEFIIVTDNATKSAMRKAVEKKVQSISAKINSTKAKNEFLSYAKYYTFFDTAPVVIAVVVQPYDSVTRRIMKLYNIEIDYVSTANVQGPAAATNNLLVAAASLGYGTCWMTGPLMAKNSLEKILNIRSPDELMVIVPLGVPDENPEFRSRKNIDEVIKVITPSKKRGDTKCWSV